MTITLLYAGLLSLWLLVLSVRVIAIRSQGISLGDGGNPVVLRRVRARGNFAEYVPMILVMIGFLEISHFSALWIHLLGGTLVVSRLLHGYALSFNESFKFGRIGGTALTLTLLGVCGFLCIYQALVTH